MQFGEVTVKRALDIVSAAYPFRSILEEDICAYWRCSMRVILYTLMQI